MTYLTFSAEFNAVHRLWNPDLDEATNIELFAECAVCHGHLYRIEVTVKAPVLASHPVVIERADIRRIIDDVLTPKLQDCDMNTVFGRENFISTGENIIPEVRDLLVPTLPAGVELAAVTIVSTQKNSFSLPGESEARRLA
jgi:6-pyruvoyltetrahydropterin/6-carboxytetrahydropterin synthase